MIASAYLLQKLVASLLPTEEHKYVRGNSSKLTAMKNTQVKAFSVAFQGTDSGMLKLNPLMLVMYMAKYWKIKYNLTIRGFVKEDTNEDRTQA